MVMKKLLAVAFLVISNSVFVSSQSKTFAEDLMQVAVGSIQEEDLLLTKYGFVN
jgi:hypothetical protein